MTPTEGDGVAEHVQEGAAHVEVVAGMAVADARRRQVMTRPIVAMMNISLLLTASGCSRRCQAS